MTPLIPNLRVAKESCFRKWIRGKWRLELEVDQRIYSVARGNGFIFGRRLPVAGLFPDSSKQCQCTARRAGF